MNKQPNGIFCLPSRGRPKNLDRFINAYLATGAQAPVYLRLDDDDPMLADYERLVLPSPNWTLVIAPRHPLRCNGVIEELLARWPSAAYYGLVSDDLLPMTPGWDRKLIAAAGRNRLAYGDDGYQGEKLATHPVVGGDFARALEWLVLPGLEHSYIDTALFKVAERADRLVYLPDVRTLHMHPMAGKAELDATYRFNDEDLFAKDRRVCLEWFYGLGFAEAVQRVKTRS